VPTLLIIDDEQSIRDAVRMIFEYDGYRVIEASGGEQGIASVSGADAVLLDVKLGKGIDGLEVLERIGAERPGLPVVMISGHATLSTAVDAARKGAFDVLEKPLDRDRLTIVVRNAIRQSELAAGLAEERAAKAPRMIGSSEPMRQLRALLERVAPTDARILITGENGTGKEVVARLLHAMSRRAAGPFVAVNCAAIPHELIESELFGHEKGAFTGAAAQRIGKFEQAAAGTILLDEVGDMSLEAQAKVLRIIEEGSLERVGGTRTIAADVRIIAATNKDLAASIGAGTFREDLFHRLNVIPMRVPALSERREDVPELARAFLAESAARLGRELSFTDDALAFLKVLEYPGNVRQLRNLTERAAVLADRAAISRSELERILTDTHRQTDLAVFDARTWEEFKELAEKEYISRKLREFNWNISRLAEEIGLQRSHLYTKLKKYGLQREGDPAPEE
jgi:DNA-binding NtrC family response regulator